MQSGSLILIQLYYKYISVRKDKDWLEICRFTFDNLDRKNANKNNK